jgi:hypothetical protein
MSYIDVFEFEGRRPGVLKQNFEKMENNYTYISSPFNSFYVRCVSCFYSSVKNLIKFQREGPINS